MLPRDGNYLHPIGSVKTHCMEWSYLAAGQSAKAVLLPLSQLRLQNPTDRGTQTGGLYPQGFWRLEARGHGAISISAQ